MFYCCCSDFVHSKLARLLFKTTLIFNVDCCSRCCNNGMCCHSSDAVGTSGLAAHQQSCLGSLQTTLENI